MKHTYKGCQKVSYKAIPKTFKRKCCSSFWRNKPWSFVQTLQIPPVELGNFSGNRKKSLEVDTEGFIVVNKR